MVPLTTAINGAQGLTFGRRSTVSLVSAQWGGIRIGRDYDPAFWNLNFGDVFGSSGSGQARNFERSVGGIGLIATRASNSISNWTPNTLGGFGAHYMHHFGENASNVANKKDGTGDQLRLFYNAGGALSAGAAYAHTNYLSGDVVERNLYAGYDFKVAKVVASYSRDSLGALRAKGGSLGTTIPVGSHVLKAAYSWYGTSAAGNPKTKRLAIGDVYYLSKRTWLYATLVHQTNSGGAAVALGGASTGANKSSNSLELGYVVSF